MRRKGAISPILITIFVVLLLIVGIFTAVTINDYFKTATEQTKLEMYKTQLDITKGTTTTISGESGVTTTTTTEGCKYSYASVKPYMIFKSQDNAGTATNPTYYFYNKNPATLTNGEYWGSERDWTDETGTYFDSGTASSGSLAKQFDPGTELWVHASVSGYEDKFIHFVVPVCGDVDPGDATSSSIGLLAGGQTYVTPQYDTTAWTSSAIDLGVSTTANNTNYKHTKDTTYRVTTNKAVYLDQIYLNMTQYYETEGVHKIQFILTKGGTSKTITIYDYESGIDNTKWVANNNQTYNSKNYKSHTDLIRLFKYGSDEPGTFSVRVYADTNTVVGTANGYLENSEVVGHLIARDVEGNNIIDQDIQG